MDTILWSGRHRLVLGTSGLMDVVRILRLDVRKVLL